MGTTVNSNMTATSGQLYINGICVGDAEFTLNGNNFTAIGSPSNDKEEALVGGRRLIII